MTAVSVDFDRDVFAQLGKSPTEVARDMKLATVVFWYARGLISQSRAAEIAGISRIELTHALAEAGVSVNQETLDDVERVLELGR